MTDRPIQVWVCPTCGHTYASPLPIISMNCPNNHGRKRNRMVKQKATT